MALTNASALLARSASMPCAICSVSPPCQKYEELTSDDRSVFFFVKMSMTMAVLLVS